MTIENFISQAGIPLLLFFICMFYGMRLLITQDAGIIRNDRKKLLKDEKEYARKCGILVLFYGAGTLLMIVLLFVNVYAAVGEIILWTVALGIGWKITADQHERKD